MGFGTYIIYFKQYNINILTEFYIFIFNDYYYVLAIDIMSDNI